MNIKPSAPFSPPSPPRGKWDTPNGHRFKTSIIKQFHIDIWFVTFHKCPNFKGCSAKPLLEDMDELLHILKTRLYDYLAQPKSHKNMLTHFPIARHICVGELGQHWFRLWLAACSAPSHYLKQCWLIVNWTIGNTLQRHSNWNVKLFIHGNAFKNQVCEMAAILSRERWLT